MCFKGYTCIFGKYIGIYLVHILLSTLIIYVGCLSRLQLVRNVLEVGRAGVDPTIPSPLMYEWHGSRYYGAAHGIAGILSILLQVCHFYMTHLFFHLGMHMYIH